MGPQFPRFNLLCTAKPFPSEQYCIVEYPYFYSFYALLEASFPKYPLFRPYGLILWSGRQSAGHAKIVSLDFEGLNKKREKEVGRWRESLRPLILFVGLDRNLLSIFLHDGTVSVRVEGP